MIQSPKHHDANAVEIPERHRLHVRLARAWAMARGRPLDPIALTIIVLAKEECIDAPLKLWVLDDLAEFVWSRLAEWCAAYEVARPPELATTLWLYLEFLDAAGELAPGSDDIDELRKSLMAYGGLDQFGRSRAAGRGRRTGRKQLASRAGLAPIIPLRPLSA